MLHLSERVPEHLAGDLIENTSDTIGRRPWSKSSSEFGGGAGEAVSMHGLGPRLTPTKNKKKRPK